MPAPILVPIILRWVASYLVKTAIGTLLRESTPFEALSSYIQYRFGCSKELADFTTSAVFNGGKLRFSIADMHNLAKSPELAELNSSFGTNGKGETRALIQRMIKDGKTQFAKTSSLAVGDPVNYLKMLSDIENVDLGIKSELANIVKTNKSITGINIKLVYDEKTSITTIDDLKLIAARNSTTLATSDVKSDGIVVLNPIIHDRYACAQEERKIANRR